MRFCQGQSIYPEGAYIYSVSGNFIHMSRFGCCLLSGLVLGMLGKPCPHPFMGCFVCFLFLFRCQAGVSPAPRGFESARAKHPLSVSHYDKKYVCQKDVHFGTYSACKPVFDELLHKIVHKW